MILRTVDENKMKITGKKIYIIILASLLLLSLVFMGFIYLKNKPQITTINSTNAEIMVYHYTKENIAKLSPQSTVKSQKLPDSLVITPGTYQINNQNFDFTKEGLYRILIVPEVNFQRIVYKNDIETLLSSLSWIDSHGTRDDDLKFKALEEKAKSEKIILTCGPISKFAQYILDKQKIPSRVVSGITQEKTNGFDDSHTMIEVKIDSSWQVFDLDNNTYFTKNNQNLNFQNLVNALNSDQEFEIRKLAYDSGIAIANFKDNNNYDYSLYGESILSTDHALKDWYKRVLGTVLTTN